MTGIFTMTNTNTVNIHIFFPTHNQQCQSKSTIIITLWGKSITVFTTAGPGNTLLVLEGCQKSRKKKNQKHHGLKNRPEMWLNEMEACSPQMYCVHGKRNFKSKHRWRLERRKLCVVAGWQVCLSETQHCVQAYVIGLLQPRYVMPNLMAIRRQEKKWRNKKQKTLRITVKYEHIAQKARFALWKVWKSMKQMEHQVPAAVIRAHL